MRFLFQLTTITDVVLLAVISNAFWLIIFLVSVWVFRNEIRLLLGSLNSFSIAGSRFELSNARATLESNIILSNIFADLLSDEAVTNKLVEIFPTVSAQRLGQFIIKYLDEIKKDKSPQNLQLLRNVAFIVGNKGNFQDGLKIYDSLLKLAPKDIHLLNEKGRLLLEFNFNDAAKLFEGLVKENQGNPVFRYNYVIARVALDQFEFCIEDLRKVIDDGYWRSYENLLDNVSFYKLAKVKPVEFNELRELVNSLILEQNTPEN